MSKRIWTILLFIFGVSTCFADKDMSILMQRLYNDAMLDGSCESVEKYMSYLQRDGTFNDLEYQPDTNQGARDLRTHVNRLYGLAYAYRFDSKINKFYKNSIVLSKIKSGWDYIAFEAPDNKSPNWWYSKIGLPRCLWQGLVLVKDEVGQQAINAVYAKYSVKTNAWLPSEDKDNNAGANLADRAVVAFTEAVLRNDSSRIKEIRKMLENELCNFQGYCGAGVRPDMSFHQHPIVVGKGNPVHRAQYYAGGYGTGYCVQISRLATWMRDTDYALSEKAVDRIVSYILDGQQWMMKGATFEPTATGRGISRKGTVIEGCSKEMIYAVKKLLVMNKRTDELEKYLQRMSGDFKNSDNYISGNKMFWQSDVMVHRRQKYMMAVRMFSERMIRPECWPTENKMGYYLGDGFTSIMLAGSEYGTETGREILPCWDWEMLPGTTVEYSGNVPFKEVRIPWPTNNPTLATSVGVSDFVGGVSDGVYGMAAFDYKRQQVNVLAKKAWFFFDDYIVALGSEIKTISQSDAEVRTSVNQILLKGDVTYCWDGQIQKLPGEKSVDDAGIDWVYHRDTGYIVSGNDCVVVSNKRQTGRWEDIGSASGEITSEVFSLSLEHDENPQDGKYQYVVVPGVDVEELQVFYREKPFDILVNSSKCQAVFDRNAKVLQVAFYEPSLLEVDEKLKIETDVPVLLMLYINDNKLNIWVSDPTQKLKGCHLDVSLKANYMSDLETNKEFRARVKIQFPNGEFAGKSVVKIIK